MKRIIILLLILVYANSADEEFMPEKQSIIKNTLFTINNEYKTRGDVRVENKKGIILKNNDSNSTIINTLLNDYTLNFKENKENDNINENTIQNEYLFDYRLINHCKFTIKDERNSIIFTIRKREKKMSFLFHNSNDQNDMDNSNSNELQIEFSLNESNINQFNENLIANCKERKLYIENLKAKLFNFFEKEYTLKSESNLLKLKLRKTLNKKKTIESYLTDSKKFVEEKLSLQKLSNGQIFHLNLLKKKSEDLKLKSLKEKKFVEDELIDLNRQKESKINSINSLSGNILKLQEKIKKLKDRENQKQNELILAQKNVHEFEAELNKLRSEKSSVENNYKDLFSKKITEQENNKMIQLEQKGVEQKKKNLNDNLVQSMNKVYEVERLNNIEKQQIADIDKKINELIIERSLKVEKIKSNLDVIKSCKDNISNVENELNELNYRNSFIKMKVTEKDKIISDAQVKERNLSKKKDETINKYNMHSKILNDAKLTFTKIFEEVKVLKSIVSDNEKQMGEYSRSLREFVNEKDTLEEKQSNLELEIKRIITNLKYNDLQIQNFQHQLNKLLLNNENVNINTYKNPMTDIESLNSEYNSEKNQLVKEIEETQKNLNTSHRLFEQNSNELESFTENFVAEIPSARVLLDIIKEEMINIIEHTITNDDRIEPSQKSKNDNSNNETKSKLEKIQILINLIKS